MESSALPLLPPPALPPPPPSLPIWGKIMLIWGEILPQIDTVLPKISAAVAPTSVLSNYWGSSAPMWLCCDYIPRLARGKDTEKDIPCLDKNSGNSATVIACQLVGMVCTTHLLAPN